MEFRSGKGREGKAVNERVGQLVECYTKNNYVHINTWFDKMTEDYFRGERLEIQVHTKYI